MTRAGKLVAVNDVCLQSPRDAAAELQWFYGSLIGLLPVATQPGIEKTVLRFKSDRLELQIKLVDAFEPDNVSIRATFEVPLLEEAADVLRERGYEFEMHRGLDFTDRSLHVVDPAGNRVVIRRRWGWALV